MAPIMAKYLQRELFLQTLIILSIVYSSVSAFQCSSGPNCKYNTNSSTDCDMSCTIPNEKKSNIPSFSISARKSKSLTVLCITTNMDYNAIPDMGIGPVDWVTFTQCPLPSDMSLLSVTRKMGVSTFGILKFTSYKINLLNILTKNHFSGLQDIKMLHLHDCGLTDLPVDFFEHLPNLTHLNLRSNKLKFPQGIFDPLVNLDFLELGRNNITHFEPKIFKKLNKLKMLNLWKNNLKNVQKDLFEGLDQLVSLDLHSNGIVTLNEDVFSSLKNLSELNLMSNEFSSLPSKLFNNNKKLSVLKLSHNRQSLKIIPDNLFADLYNLRNIFLDRNNIEVISGTAFSNSSMITQIELNNNALKSLPSELFKSQTALIKLNLRRNLLNKLPNNLFATLKNLTILDLSFNQIENITKDYFNGLVSLDFLFMNNNKLKIIDQNAFSNVKQPALKSIFMSNNLLTNSVHGLNSPFQALQNLEKLVLRNNSLTGIFRDWRLVMPNLRNLDISQNKIDMISFEDIHFLGLSIETNLTNNNISAIDFRKAEFIAKIQEVPDAYSLQPSIEIHRMGRRILLGNNPINCDCSVYHLAMYFEGKLDVRVRSTVEIEDGENLVCAGPELLKDIPITKVNSKSLECILDNPNTKNKFCPEKCNCTVRIHDLAQIINCSYAGLTEVPQLRANNDTNFTELYLQGNHIVELPTTEILEYFKVRVLNASFNNITTFSTENIPKDIEVLELANNNLTCIDMPVLTYLLYKAPFRRISLGLNPWKCNCYTLDVLLHVQNKFQSNWDLSNITCFGKKVQHKSKISIPEALSNTDNIIISLFIIVLFFIFAIYKMLLVAFYKYQSDIKVWMFANKLLQRFVTKKELGEGRTYDALILSTYEDEEFVADLVKELESGTAPFRVCNHSHDGTVDHLTQTQISINDSKRIILVISPKFLSSVWGKKWFNVAISEECARVILIIYGDIGPTEHLDSDLRSFMHLNTYIKWGDRWFWQRLRFALPHVPQGLTLRTLNTTENSS